MEETKIYIEQITFNDGSSFSFDNSDIVVFTGPNNSGKSQVLRDIKNYFGNKNIQRIIATDITPQFLGDVEYLKKKCINKNGTYYLDNISVDINNLGWKWEQKKLGNISTYFINHLSTESRLQAANPANTFDAVNDFPVEPLHKLYIDDKKEKELSSLFHQAFGTEFIVNRGAGSQIPIHVGMTPTMDEGEDRVSMSYLSKLKKLPQIQNQGDGMRSFAGILLDTFISNHCITLIDEPEAFLHPPQARLLGKLLAKNTPNDRQLFISTHSEDFLKGLLDADNEHIKIIRINREGDVNHMNILNNEEVKNLWKDSILRYSNILRGLFHSKVVICESDTDCRFYQAVLYAMQNEDSINPDILFTHCGGKQRLKVVIKALRSLNVKTVAIMDIDALNDKTTFKDIIESSGMIWGDIETFWNKINQYVKDQRAQLNTEEVKKEIDAIFDSFNEPQLTTDITDKIKKVIKQSSAWSKVKETGKSFFTGDAYKAFQRIYDLCKCNGLLIVPVGELECFYKPDSNHGVKWVNNVLENVNLKDDPELDQARSFVEEILVIK
ncbi:AAA family ATPase [uncultured Alistipes sp.]|uniref:ATP-dependent nuclease n=1 Tax=uncultured Alistipes sp. TaxID=538949 RepID=UPI002594BE4C|nr:AAA family ATPase [uncultured Alistipes sp.]